MSSALPTDNKGHFSSLRFDSFPDLCDTVRDAVCVVVGGPKGGRRLDRRSVFVFFVFCFSLISEALV